MDTEAFRQPERIYRGTDFWMLNERLTDEGIVEQLRAMRDAGVYSFIARTYIGLMSDYPGPEFRRKMHLIIDTARELGLRVIVQAGYMPEAVLGLPEDYALRYIVPVRESDAAASALPVFCRHEGYVFVEENSRTFLDMFRNESMDFYLKKSYEEMWAEFADEYGKTILSVWVDEPSYSDRRLPWTPGLDVLYRERFGGDLRADVWKLYFDADGSSTVRYRYRVLLRDLLEKNYFEKVSHWCHANNLWFSGHLMMEETLTLQILRASATMPYYKYLDIPGIDVLCGAMNWPDSPMLPSSPNSLEYTQYTTALQCVSAAHQAGKGHILAEMYGVTTEGLTFRDQLCMFSAYAAMGINHRSVHGMFYSLRGRRKRAYPPHVNYYQPYWPKYRNMTDACARISEFISEGRPSAEIAVVHPLETGYMLFRGGLDNHSGGGDALRDYDPKLYRLLYALCSIHRGAELCDVRSLERDGGVHGERLAVGEMEYGTVILPFLKVLPESAVTLLERFARAGGRLLILGDAPDMLDGVLSPELPGRLLSLPGVEQFADLTALECRLAEQPGGYTLEGGGAENLLVNHRVCPDGDRFLLYDKDCAHAVRARLTLDGARRARVFDPLTGDVSECGACFDGVRTTVGLEVPNGGCVLLSLERTDASAVRMAEGAVPVTVLPMDGRWTVTAHDPNVLLLEYCRYRCGEGEFSKRLPVMAVQTLLTQADYRGPVTLQYELHTDTALEGLQLAVEEPEIQRFFLDGRELANCPDGYFRDHTFRTIPAGSLTPGAHLLEVQCEFAPLSKVTTALTQLFETQRGMELEPMYLLGDFAVRALPQASINGCQVYAARFTLTDAAYGAESAGELTGCGYPFYVGEATMEQTFRLAGEPGADARVVVGEMSAAVAEVYVNGQYAGDVSRAPCALRCGTLLRAGENTLSIKLYSTLRNIIGPFHRPQGEIGNVFGGGYENPNQAWLSVDVTVPGWENDLESAYPGWTDCYNVAAFGVRAVRVEYGSKRSVVRG